MQKRYEMENQTLEARAAAESAKRDEATARSTLATEQKNYSVVASLLAEAVAKKTAAEQEETAYRSALAASAGQRQILAARVSGTPAQATRGIVQIFLRQGSAAGERCAEVLTAAGFTVGGVEQATHGPQNDEVKYFWPSDLSLATEVGKLAGTCNLKVPSFNYILITGDPNSANSPPKYLELWAGTTH